ncbi:branched-chain amino acid ABC transporter ATP-binding protein/permease [Nitratireductor mangrovi]|uniref:Branched-chain amino acid ABC transporter ATP-binding protein/permease n=1 Tax=Nitratireductor mangrovi TaxID=2599600 RepID=A0A5B8L5N5_9HYPH|nr:branched-chain amino acid ABC transporter ATP-binding protein/permease [Nitratireductor mangrovi]QDZ03247.1 branched-chain amino acid ABC transporter ATP-binding protein/permease [Nitratireductor mangrovi]
MLAIPLLPFVPDFWVTLLDFVGLASLVALGLVLLTGVGGMTSFGQAAFVGFGAYASALLTTAYGWSPWMTLPVSLAVTIAAALLIGLVTVRLSGHYLPLGTIAWGISFYYLFGNLKALGAYDGISSVPPLSLFGYDLLDSRAFYFIVWGFVLLSILLTANLLDSRVGRSIRALRSGAAAAESVGVNVWRAKLTVFVYAAVLAGLSGWLYAHFQRAVTPGVFNLSAGIEYLLMAVLGGAGHIYGAILGAGIVVVSKNFLQDLLPVFFGHTGNYEGIVFGVILIAMLQGAREGIWPLIAARVARGEARAVDPAGTLTGRGFDAKDETLLSVRSVRKEFGGLVAVDDVSFDVGRAEIVGLIGPNGAGKSTTFNLVTGVLPLSGGEIHFAGERIDRLGPEKIAERRIARTFQHVKLAPAMSVLENVAIGAHLRGSAGLVAGMLKLDRAEERDIFGEAARQIERVGLADVMHRPAGTLALGQQRLAEIARALCVDPRLLLLDEPAAGLRHMEKQALADLIRGLREEGMSVLLVEHDMDFVMRLTDHIVVLNFGARIATGAPAAIQSDPAVIEAYLGSPA